MGQVAAQHADYTKNAGGHITAGQAYKIDCSGAAAQYYCKDGAGDESVKGVITGNLEDASIKKGDAKWEGGAQEVFDLSELNSDKGNVIISNPGIYNSKEDAFRNAVKQNPEAAKNGTLVVVWNNPSYEAIPMLSEVVFYAAYDKINDQLGAILPLTNAEKKNVAINQYAQENYGTDKQILLEKSNHSRGGLTESVSLQYSNKHGITGIPIELSRFYGTATSIDAYLNHIAKNGYVNNDGISTTVSGATHIVDFVGRPPLILGGNPATGGACTLCYSHSSYYGALPNEFLVDASNKNILDKNNKPIKNPEYDKYVKIWGEPTKGSNGQNLNLSAPKIMLKDKEGNTHLIDQEGKTTILNEKGKIVKEGFVTPIKIDSNGNRYIEMEGKKYHANAY